MASKRKSTETNNIKTVAHTSRRTFLKATAAATAAVHAPTILAQSRAPIKIGVLSCFTGVAAASAETNWNGM
ncbi:MAG: twin-arginine translocation signal domain-containing protein [Betaproteobacteria bacterium]|nr:twin-arginine translocation signal domain-containing protein [Betaproteobacteria bacterium]